MNLDKVLTKPRITEKAVRSMNQNVYTFDIDPRANKIDVTKAVKHVYSFTPVKVAVVTVKAKEKRNRRTGKAGMTSGGKKAYVYLKKGDTIAVF
jgi:large subunit ribosomal protein L23